MNQSPTSRGMVIQPKHLLRAKNGDGPISATPKPDASPWWKAVRPATSGEHDQFFAITSGQVLSIAVELPTDSMLRFLWPRFSVSQLVSGRYWMSSTHILTGEDIDDDRASWDFLKDIDIQITLDTNGGKVVMDWCSIANIQGNDEFGRVRLPHLLPKNAMMTLQFRNNAASTRYVSGFVFGWRIRL